MREIIWPAKIEADMMPAISGSISRPAAVGEKPLTICRYSGIETRPPNMPMPRMKFSTEPMANVLPENSRSGMSASSP